MCIRDSIQGYLNVNNRVACEDTRLHSALDTLINRLDIFLRDSTANDLVDELVALAGLVRLNDDLNMAVLALTTGLTSVLLINVSGAADGLLVSNLRRTYVSLYLELAQQDVYKRQSVMMDGTQMTTFGLNRWIPCTFAMNSLIMRSVIS